MSKFKFIKNATMIILAVLIAVVRFYPLLRSTFGG